MYDFTNIMCDKIKIGINTLICMVSDLKVVINHLLDAFVKEGVQEDSLYSIRLLKNRLDELFEKLFLVYDGVSEDSIFPLKEGGKQLDKLFEKLIKESRQSLNQQEISNVINEEILVEWHKYYQDKSFDKESIIQEIFVGNPFHGQQISAALYKEILTELHK